MTWKTVQSTEKPPLHNGIKCLTCDTMLKRKSECFDHKGHDVVYLDKNGEPAK